jgi:O-antigen/teichoic acid export membrane protein
MAINQLFPPIASRLFSERNFEELERVYSVTARWAFTFTLPLALVVAIYDVEILKLFGSEFVAGGNVVLLFAIGRTISSAVGPTGYLLMMTDNQYYSMLNQWLLGVLNIALNYVLILEFGLIGAAVATVVVLILINFIRVGEVWYLERITPFSDVFLKPIIAGLVAGIVMIQIEKFFAGYALLVVGSGVGVSVFFGLLALFGIEDQDKELLEKAIQTIS